MGTHQSIKQELINKYDLYKHGYSFLFSVIFFSCCCCYLYFLATATSIDSLYVRVLCPCCVPQKWMNVLYTAWILFAHKRFSAFVCLCLSFSLMLSQAVLSTLYCWCGVNTTRTQGDTPTHFIPTPPHPSGYKEASPFCILHCITSSQSLHTLQQLGVLRTVCHRKMSYAHYHMGSGLFFCSS